MTPNLVLILNCGSSSLKFAVIDPVSATEYLSGLAEALTLDDARIKWKLNGEKNEANLGAGAGHDKALDFIVSQVLTDELKKGITAIGHRVVHGGEKYTKSVLIDDTLLKGIEEVSSFAPLHNPANILGIQAAYKAFPELKNKNVAVFDTAFHQTMPEKSFLYAIPYELYEKHGIRRYGFHGTSHYFIATQAAELLNKDLENTNIINCHLGNGASVCAIKDGKSIDTSMGFTPLEGLVMGTRSGDLDPAIIFHLHQQLGKSVAEIEQILVKKSGLQGLTQVSSDCRYAEDNFGSEKGATRALESFAYRLAKYIGSYMAIIGKLDAITFTGGIGENSAKVRELTLEHLKLFGIKIDENRNLNARFGKSGLITADDSAFPAFVIPTNEELIIAKDTFNLTK